MAHCAASASSLDQRACAPTIGSWAESTVCAKETITADGMSTLRSYRAWAEALLETLR